MISRLIKAETFCVFTFISTSHALKAEKVLKQSEIVFVMMPTPRAISVSCGISVKVFPQCADDVNKVLTQNRVSIDGIYRVVKDETQSEVIQRIDCKFQ